MRDRLYRCLEGKLLYTVDEGKLAAGHPRRDMWLKQKAPWRYSQSNTLNKYKEWKPTLITAQDIQEFSSLCIKFTSPTCLLTHPFTTKWVIYTEMNTSKMITYINLYYYFILDQVPIEKSLIIGILVSFWLIAHKVKKKKLH